MRTKIAVISLVGLFIVALVVTMLQIQNARYANTWTMPSFHVFMPMDKALGAPDTYVGGGALILPASSYTACTDLGGGICVVNGGWQIANPVVPEVVFTNLDVNTLTPGTAVCAGTGGKLQTGGCSGGGSFTAVAAAKVALDDSVSSQGTFYSSLSQYTNVVLADSPTALYEAQDFNKALGTGNAIDSSQNGNAGTYCSTASGFSGCSSVGGSGLTLRATGLTVDGRSMQSTSGSSTPAPFIVTPLTVSTPFTIEAWINFSDLTTRVTGDTIASNSATVQGIRFETISSSKELRLAVIDNTGTAHFVTGSTVLSDNTTYFVAATLDGAGNGVIYLNGVQEASGAPGLPGSTGTTSLDFGHGDNGNNGWKGKMSDLAVYPSVLTAQQILSHYHAGIGDWPYLQDITNTKIAAAPTDKDVLTWVNADSKWENKAISAAGGVTAVTGSGVISVTAGATPVVSCPTCATSGTGSLAPLTANGTATPDANGGIPFTNSSLVAADQTFTPTAGQTLVIETVLRQTATSSPGGGGCFIIEYVVGGHTNRIGCNTDAGTDSQFVNQIGGGGFSVGCTNINASGASKILVIQTYLFTSLGVFEHTLTSSTSDKGCSNDWTTSTIDSAVGQTVTVKFYVDDTAGHAAYTYYNPYAGLFANTPLD